jgi:uncharacterized protein with HEPN domain
MAPERDHESVRHMLDHAREAIKLAEGRGRPDLERDRMLQLSLIRLVEVVGEAASRVSSAFRDSHPQIPWALIIATRNRLIHGYDFLDNEVLWQTVTKDLPPLVAELERSLH